jgi:hypothetical protein
MKRPRSPAACSTWAIFAWRGALAVCPPAVVNPANPALQFFNKVADGSHYLLVVEITPERLEPLNFNAEGLTRVAVVSAHSCGRFQRSSGFRCLIPSSSSASDRHRSAIYCITSRAFAVSDVRANLSHSAARSRKSEAFFRRRVLIVLPATERERGRISQPLEPGGLYQR